MTPRDDGATTRQDAARRRGNQVATRQRGGYNNPAAHILEWHGSEDGEGGGGIVCDWQHDCPLLVTGSKTAKNNIEALGLNWEATG